VGNPFHRQLSKIKELSKGKNIQSVNESSKGQDFYTPMRKIYYEKGKD